MRSVSHLVPKWLRKRIPDAGERETLKRNPARTSITTSAGKQAPTSALHGVRADQDHVEWGGHRSGGRGTTFGLSERARDVVDQMVMLMGQARSQGNLVEQLGAHSTSPGSGGGPLSVRERSFRNFRRR